jgi:uncharacterized protein (TIGR02246 family)
MTPDIETIVQEQIDAYNARDLDRTLSYYAPNATIVSSDGTVMDEGRNAIRAAYENVFAENPEIHAEVPVIFHVGEWVTIHSIVPDWLMPDGSRQEMQSIEVYRVVDGKIKELHLYR